MGLSLHREHPNYYWSLLITELHLSHSPVLPEALVYFAKIWLLEHLKRFNLSSFLIEDLSIRVISFLEISNNFSLFRLLLYEIFGKIPYDWPYWPFCNLGHLEMLTY